MRFPDAACLDTDPMLFFPERHQNARAAKAVCAACPCIRECLDFALTVHNTQDDFGVWGGTSVNERKVLRRGAA